MTGTLWVMLPLACLTGGALAVYLCARLTAASNGLLALFTALILAVTLGMLLPLVLAVHAIVPQPDTWSMLPSWGYPEPGGTALRTDPGALLLTAIALGLGMLVAIYSGRYLALDQRYEIYYPLLLLLMSGLAGMVHAADLFSLYLFCELMSVTAYILVAFRRHTDTAIEAGFKYLLMGSLGTAIILMGISLIYRETGRLDVIQIVELGDTTVTTTGSWARIGRICLMVGLSVKSAAVPFHTWLPDAHGRAPSSISAMLSGIVIQSAFYVLLKVSLGLGLPVRTLGNLLIAISLLNMTLGNGLALVQIHTKRLLAYSTIAQMGYVMFSVGIGLRYAIPAAIQAGFFLMVAHAAMKGLAFMSKGVCHFYNGSTTVAQLRGTATQLPLAAMTFGLALGALAGIPPLAGFAGKWLILTQALGCADTWAYVGGAIFLLNGLISLGYYLPLVGMLWAPAPPSHAQEIKISPWMAISLVILGGIVLAMGFYPAPWLHWTAGIGQYLLTLKR